MIHDEEDSAVSWANAVPIVAPSADFAARVLARVDPVARRARRRWTFAAAGAVVALAAGIVLAIGFRLPSAGSALANDRTTLPLGRRGLAVLESGAALSFTVAAGGDAHINQTAGDVFYRVERRGPFVVHTKAGRIEATGTCFRVEVLPMPMTKLKTAAVSSAATALILVSVYEGKVRVANGKGVVAVAAGENATVSPEAAPVAVSSGDADAFRANSSGDAAAAGLATPESQGEQLASARARVAALTAQIDEIQAARKRNEERQTVFPSKDELLKRAKECTLVWDMPDLYSGRDLPEHVGKWYTKDENERAIIAEVRSRYSDRFAADIRRLYVDATGDRRGAEILSLGAMKAEIQSKAVQGENKRVFQRLSAEKAGLVAPPTDVKDATAYERLLRLLTTTGDDFERELAKELGPERARAARGKHWENTSSSTAGCPPER